MITNGERYHNQNYTLNKKLKWTSLSKDVSTLQTSRRNGRIKTNRYNSKEKYAYGNTIGMEQTDQTESTIKYTFCFF